MGPVDFSTAFVDASLEFGDGQRPGLHNDFVVPLRLSPYAAPSWVAAHGRAIDAGTPRSALIHHLTLSDAWEGWFARQGIKASPGHEGPRYEVMSMALNATVAGMGVALLPSYMTGDLLAAGKLERLSDTAWQHPKGYYLVYPPASAQMRALKVFRDWLLQQHEAGAAEGSLKA
ncbi:transcriptional regulator LysR family [Cupriavidus necator N-1]|uniref:Transcriptional regulator LysR family n=1 Tax=Cupriavidus necator (strain ATCC 43291 / DSM 13513 / CCUG 52238 / LMG 8453 / N-1) TaxID=1042878 RepID=G0ERP0_CUPNN|nr:transcriptional regulator LysR family [Cupriavidus necator N-1]KAI3606577.1 hypothetical protein D8I24_1613 [Cupriavidus necator H850]